MAKTVVGGKEDYLLSAKGNCAGLEANITDYAQDAFLRKSKDTGVQKEKNRGRIETRTAFTANNIAWFLGRKKRSGLPCIGTIHTKFEEKGRKTSQWHYISSRKLTVPELLHHALVLGCLF